MLAFLLFGVIGTGAGSQSGQVVPVGSVGPGFTLPVPDRRAAGQPRRAGPTATGRWCSTSSPRGACPCQQETPLLAQTAAAEQAKGSPVQFIGVDVADTPSSAMAFVQQAGITYPMGVDADLKVTTGLYGLNGEPNTFFIDASGHVVGHKLGALNRASSAELSQITSS